MLQISLALLLYFRIENKIRLISFISNVTYCSANHYAFLCVWFINRSLVRGRPTLTNTTSANLHLSSWLLLPERGIEYSSANICCYFLRMLCLFLVAWGRFSIRNRKVTEKMSFRSNRPVPNSLVSRYKFWIWSFKILSYST